MLDALEQQELLPRGTNYLFIGRADNLQRYFLSARFLNCPINYTQAALPQTFQHSISIADILAGRSL
jgi:hypothetical protein